MTVLVTLGNEALGLVLLRSHCVALPCPVAFHFSKLFVLVVFNAFLRNRNYSVHNGGSIKAEISYSHRKNREQLVEIYFALRFSHSAPIAMVNVPSYFKFGCLILQCNV